MRRLILGLGVGLLLAGCGGGGLTLTEYVDGLNDINDRTLPQAEVLISELEAATTTKEAGATMAQMAALRIESVEATEALRPPESIAELHELLLAWERSLIPIEESFAERAGTAPGWEEFLGTDEVSAYRDALVEGKRACTEFQAKLDATADRGAFADTPWIPTALSEVVEARLGCELFPEDPQSVFRPAPPTTFNDASGEPYHARQPRSERF